MPKQVIAVDPLVVANPRQAQHLPDCRLLRRHLPPSPGRRLADLFAGLYWAGLGPEEAIALSWPVVRRS